MIEKKRWTDDEINYLKENGPIERCEDIAIKFGRTVRSVRHKFLELSIEKKRAKIGDIVNGWKIIGIDIEHTGNQYVRMATIESTLEDKTIKRDRLTKLTNNQIGWPIRKRPDLAERNTTHGMSRTRIYRVWAGMVSRCNPNSKSSNKAYTDKGIIVCEEWKKFDVFFAWANTSGYVDGLTIDRKDESGSYTPDNCRWIPFEEQSDNKCNADKTEIEAFGEKKTIHAWCRDDRCSVSVAALRYRIDSGWDIEEAIITPSSRKMKISPIDWMQQYHPELYQEYLLA